MCRNYENRRTEERQALARYMPAPYLLRNGEKSRCKSGIQPAPKATFHIHSDIPHNSSNRLYRAVAYCEGEKRSTARFSLAIWELGERRRGAKKGGDKNF